MGLTIINAQIIAEDEIIERGWLSAVDGKIIAYAAGDPPANSDQQVIDANGRIVVPGYIDVHVHGGDGVEAMDATPEALHKLSAFYAQHGVTSFLPTTWTANHAAILAALQAIKTQVGQVLPGADILGAHVEGPYISEKKPGAQFPELIRRADEREARELLETGVIKLLALAPEYTENHWLIRACVEQGITVSAAHTDATYADMVDAVAQGVTQTTHTFNAMRGLHHREPGTVGASLSLDQLRCEIIPDGIHVHPAMVKLLYETKGADSTLIITDGVRGAGLPEGATYEQDGRTVSIVGGSARLEDATLAGSALTMDAAMRHFVTFVERPLIAVWRCASLTPARAIGMDDRKGSIKVGKDADLLLLDADLNVIMTIVGGRIVYQGGNKDVS